MKTHQQLRITNWIQPTPTKAYPQRYKTHSMLSNTVIIGSDKYIVSNLNFEQVTQRRKKLIVLFHPYDNELFFLLKPDKT
jgi:hypothetical protein